MELFRALAVLAEPPDGAEAARVAEALGLGTPPGASEYTEAFIFQLYPYASVYLGAEGMLGGEARATIAGFWRALGQTPPTEADHLSVLLALYARLVELEEGERDERRRAGWRGARRALLWEHLLSWLPAYLSKLAGITPPFYRRWGELLTAALMEEAEAVGRQELLSTHLREAPPLVDPRVAGAEDFLQSLLAPARSGMILTRDDLNRAARRLGLGSRIGERKFILKALLGQDARATLGWLAEEADGWATLHQKYRAPLGAVAEWWEERARDAAALLDELKENAGEVA
ncbi:MAG: molecular chaperone TorD family protein [Acidobacteria bacterium]|nr:molecular chaperone TorD family protein [Acidobacteriota bacterium]